MERLVIVGASGHCKIILEIAKLLGYNVVCLIDGTGKDVGKSFCGLKIMSDVELPSLLSGGVKKAFVAFGNNKARVRTGKMLIQMGFDLVTLVHPSSIISSDVTIGKGTVVVAGAIINPNCTIGNHIIINTGSTIDHDCAISDGVHISPGVNLAGNVTVGENTHIGIGSIVIEKIKIGMDAIIGAGTVVIKDIPSNVTCVGNPARVIKEHLAVHEV